MLRKTDDSQDRNQTKAARQLALGRQAKAAKQAELDEKSKLAKEARRVEVLKQTKKEQDGEAAKKAKFKNSSANAESAQPVELNAVKPRNEVEKDVSRSASRVFGRVSKYSVFGAGGIVILYAAFDRFGSFL